MLFCSAALLYFAGSAWSRSRGAVELPPVFEDAPVAQAASKTANPDAPILVHVAGAANKPGVLQFKPGARVADAIKAAGGAKSDGDLDALNLAQKLRDGEQILIPQRGAQNIAPLTDASTPGASGQGRARAVKAPPLRPVNVNTASAAELMTLPGIGPALAERIIAQRARGRFSSLSDLDAVSGLGPQKLEQLKPYVTF